MRSKRALLLAVSTLVIGGGPLVHAEPSDRGPAEIDRRTLPIPAAPYRGRLAPTVEASSPTSFPRPAEAPAGAPNVLIIMTDDTGFGAGSAFGGPIPLPVMDTLAAHGLRYNEFHTTALCSPTRAALLTGRNHHSVGFGNIVELATGYPGYDGRLPKSAATIGKVLGANGYSTSWFGKNHNTPAPETTPDGPFDRWPNELGFDYFYGFMGGETNQWAPDLFENHRSVEPPANDPTYLLDHDLADHAIGWLRTQKTSNPNRPFLMYYAPGTSHAPLDAPKAWIDRFKGQFDQGWDKMREETFARQKAAGVIPANAVLTPRPAEIPAWDSLTPRQKQIAAHMMEVYAASLAYCDNQVGRVIQELKDSGQFDNTLILYIEGDNGASGEGGLMGTTDAQNVMNGVRESEDTLYRSLEAMGGPYTEMHYPVGWAWAMNTPFQWMKQIASHLGGTRNGMVVSWPARIQAQGEVRSQFASVVDVAPTLYEAAGVPAPATVDGVKQMPLEGVSFAASFARADAADRHKVQYFEIGGNRAIYKDGWMASTHPERLPWRQVSNLSPDQYRWELYDLTHDYAQAHDLAAQQPQKLAALKAAFDIEARKHQVYPIDNRGAARALMPGAPNGYPPRTHWSFPPSGDRYEYGAWPNVVGRSWTATAHIVAPATGGDGMIFTQGGRFGGYGLYVLNGVPTFSLRTSNTAASLVSIKGSALSPGAHDIRVAAKYAGGLAGAWDLTLSIDGAPAGQAHLARSFPFYVSIEGAAVGHDTGTPIVEDYRIPFAYSGTVQRVDFDLGPVAPPTPRAAALTKKATLARE